MSDLQLYFAPRTRSFTALWLLEELGEPYELESFDISTGRHREPDYVAMNPMGKVPMLVERREEEDVAVPELGAIAVFLGDRYPKSKLAPAIDDPARAAFLRWCFFASAIMEPAFIDKHVGREVERSTAAWGSYDLMLEVVTKGVSAAAPWLLGETFSAADVLVGSNLRFGLFFGMIDVPAEHPIRDYLARLEARAALQRADAIEKREGERFPPSPAR